MTMLDTFLTFKLIFKQSMLLTSAFFGRARAHTCPKRFITERGVQGRNFEDRDFGFFPKVIICAQLTYSGGFVCPTRARGGARARTYHFLFTVACVTYHFRVNWPCWTRFWPSNWFLNIHGCTHARFLTKRAHTTWKVKFKALYIDYQVNRHAELDSHLQSFFRKLLATFLRGSPQSARVHKALTWSLNHIMFYISHQDDMYAELDSHL